MRVSEVITISEEIRSRFRVLEEGMKELLTLPPKVDKIERAVDRLELKMEVVEQVLIDHSRDIAALKTHSH